MFIYLNLKTGLSSVSISHTLAVQNKVKLSVLARLLHRVDIRHERHVLASPEEQGQINDVAGRCWASCDSVLSHRVCSAEMFSRSSRYSEAQPEQAVTKCRSA